MARAHSPNGWHMLARVVVLGLPFAWAAGCAPAGAPDPMQPAGEDVYLTVQNDNYWDARIYANWGGVRERLGLAVGKTTRTFAFRWRRDDVQFDVSFVGDGGWRSEVVVVYPGDSLELRILPGPTGRMGPGLPGAW